MQPAISRWPRFATWIQLRRALPRSFMDFRQLGGCAGTLCPRRPTLIGSPCGVSTARDRAPVACCWRGSAPPSEFSKPVNRRSLRRGPDVTSLAPSPPSTISLRWKRNCASCRGSAPAWCAGPMPTTRQTCAKSPTRLLISSCAAARAQRRRLRGGGRRARRQRSGTAGWRSGSASSLPPTASSWSADWPAESTPRRIRARSTRGGRTVAVMGCGIDVIYPPEHRKLAEAIVEGRRRHPERIPVGTPPVPENFPVRNRILIRAIAWAW